MKTLNQATEITEKVQFLTICFSSVANCFS